MVFEPHPLGTNLLFSVPQFPNVQCGKKKHSQIMGLDQGLKKKRNRIIVLLL